MGLSLFLNNCANNQEFYREKELIHFIEMNKVSFKSKKSVVLLLVGSSCGTCLEYTKEVLKQIPQDKDLNEIAIIGDEIAYKEYLGLIPNKTNLIITNSDTLFSKGLTFPSDMIFLVKESGKISKSIEINKHNRKEIAKVFESLN